MRDYLLGFSVHYQPKRNCVKMIVHGISVWCMIIIFQGGGGGGEVQE